MITLTNIHGLPRSFDMLLRILHPAGVFPESISDDDWVSIVETARKMQVIPLLHVSLGQKRLFHPPSGISRQLKGLYKANGFRNLIYTRDLTKIFSAFHKNAIAAIPLKGAHLAHEVYTDPSVRQMTDLDIMVHWEDVPRTVDLLKTLGYEAEEKISLDDEKRRYDHHGPALFHPSGTKVEVHWNITDDFNVGTRGKAFDELSWHDARKRAFLGSDAFLLSPEMLILHCVVHTTLHHSLNFGIREFFDIEQICRKYQGSIDWNYLFQNAAITGCTRPLLLILALTDLVTGSGIAEDVKRTGFVIDISESYVLAALHEIASEKNDKSVFFRISRTNQTPGILFRSTLKRLFLSRKTMEEKYHVRSDSFVIYLCYPYRFCDLIIHYAPGLVREYWNGSKESENSGLWEWIYGG